jgi:hypothetical protein
MSGKHVKTGENGFYAFCKKTGTLEHYGPYKSLYEAIRVLILTRGCDECEFNKSSDKVNLLKEIDKELEEEVKKNLGEDHILNKIDKEILIFFEYRMYLDINFNDKFGVRLFNPMPEDSMASLEFVKPCENRNDFTIKIQILAGLLDRINPKIRDLIKSDHKDEFERSIKIIEQILKENKPNYNKHIISNLKNLMVLRSLLYPVHVTGSKLISVLNNFGITRYPPDDWEVLFLQIFRISLTSLINLHEEIQQIKVT